MLQESHDVVEALLDEMKPILLRCGCNPNHVRVALGDFKLKTYNDAFDWLHRLSLSDQYLEAKRIYDMRTPETWVMYDLMGTEGLWEQDALAEAGIAVKRLWRTKKPRLFGKDKAPPEDPYPEEDVDDNETA